MPSIACDTNDTDRAVVGSAPAYSDTTVLVWVRPTGASPSFNTALMIENSGSPGTNVGIYANGSGWYGVTNNGLGSETEIGSSIYTQNAWVCAAISISGTGSSNATCYIIDESGTVTSTTITSGSIGSEQDVFWGSSSFGDPHIGQTCAAKIFPYAMSQAAIEVEARNGFFEANPNPFGIYPCEYGATALIDYSGNGNDLSDAATSSRSDSTEYPVGVTLGLSHEGEEEFYIASSGVENFVVTMTGSSALSATIKGTAALAAAMTGSSVLSATVLGTADFSAAMTGSSTLAATFARLRLFVAAMTGSSTLVATVVGTASIAAALVGSSVLSATVKGRAAIAAAMTGLSTMVSTFTVGVLNFIVAMTGSSVMAATVKGTAAVAAAMTGVSTMVWTTVVAAGGGMVQAFKRRFAGTGLFRRGGR